MNLFKGVLLALSAPGVLAQVEVKERVEISNLNPAVTNIREFFACTRLFTNDAAPTGCGTRGVEGDFGPLFEINTPAEFETLVARNREPSTLLLNPELLSNSDFIQEIASSDQVSAILLAHQDPSGTLDDPLIYDSDLISNILFKQPVALLSSGETDLLKSRITENVKRGILAEEGGIGLWENSAVFEFYGGREDVTTEFCFQEERCDPIGGQSVWGFAGSDAYTETEKEVILFTVKLDANCLFHDICFGANEVAASLSVFLGVADALSTVLPNIANLDRKIMFAAFKGESFEAVGSSRFIFDIQNTCGEGSFAEDSESCPDFNGYSTSFNQLDLSKVVEIISLDNIGDYFLPETAEVRRLFLHTAEPASDMTVALEAEINNRGLEAVVTTEGGEIQTPVASFQQLAGFTGSSVVITGYETSVTENNPFVGTHLDKVPLRSAEEYPSQTLLSLSTAVANFLVSRAAPTSDAEALATLLGTADLSLNATLLGEIEFALTQDISSPVVLDLLNVSDDFVKTIVQTSPTNRAPDFPTPPTYYSGVYVPEVAQSRLTPKLPEFVTRNFLAAKLSLSAEVILGDDSSPELFCEGDLQCASRITPFAGGSTPDALGLAGICELPRNSSAVCVMGKCICSSVHFHDALSPVVRVVDNTRFSLKDASEVNSPKVDKAFAEPRFVLPTLITFQQSNGVSEKVLMAVGVVTTSIAIAGTKVIKKKLVGTKYELP